jgi:hypothetical protein
MRDVEHEFFFEQALRTASTYVVATVAGVDHDGVESIGSTGFGCSRKRRRERYDPKSHCNRETLPFELQRFPPSEHLTTEFDASRAQ